MKAKDLKVGSKVMQLDCGTVGEVYRVSDKFVWFKYMGYERIARATIDKYKTLYKIISI